MKLLNKFKNLFAKKEVPEARPLYQEISTLVVSGLRKRKNNLSVKPDGVTEKEWELTLKAIIFAFESQAQRLTLKSKAKRISREKRITEGFNLFKINYKDL